MYLGVPDLGVDKYLLDEVYGSLYLELVSRLLPFDDQGGAHHIVARCNVEEEGFSSFGSDEDWGQHQGCFETLQILLSFLSLDEGVRLFEELVEWHPPFTKLGDESTLGS